MQKKLFILLWEPSDSSGSGDEDGSQQGIGVRAGKSPPHHAIKKDSTGRVESGKDRGGSVNVLRDGEIAVQC